MKLPEFVFLSSKELGGIEFILHTRSPYMISRAIKFESGTAMEDKKYAL